LGYLLSIYPGDSYAFDETTETYERSADSRSFALINTGCGISFIRWQKVQPFIHYDFNYFNFWEFNPYLRSTAQLKAGVKVNLK
jgi:hypothetical protein